MKRICLVILLAVVTLGTATPRAHAISAFASWWNMNDANDDGFGVGVRQKTGFTPLFAIDTRASWVGFDGLNVYPLEASGLLTLGLFYGGIGVGYYILDADKVDLDNNFGWFVMGGAEIKLTKFGVFGELKWTQLETDYNNIDPSLGDVPTSLSADGVGLNLGVTLGL